MRSVTLKSFGSAVNFNRLTPEDIKEGGSFNITDDKGQLIGIFAVPISGFKRDQIASLCDGMNQAVGKP